MKPVLDVTSAGMFVPEKRPSCTVFQQFESVQLKTVTKSKEFSVSKFVKCRVTRVAVSTPITQAIASLLLYLPGYCSRLPTDPVSQNK
jgi:hypothetical protein